MQLGLPGGARAQLSNPNPAGKGRCLGKGSRCNHSPATITPWPAAGMEDATGFWGKDQPRRGTEAPAAPQHSQHSPQGRAGSTPAAHLSGTSRCKKALRESYLGIKADIAPTFTEEGEDDISLITDNRICHSSGDKSSSFPSLRLSMQTFHHKVFPALPPYRPGDRGPVGWREKRCCSCSYSEGSIKKIVKIYMGRGCKDRKG